MLTIIAENTTILGTTNCQVNLVVESTIRSTERLAVHLMRGLLVPVVSVVGTVGALGRDALASRRGITAAKRWLACPAGYQPGGMVLARSFGQPAGSGNLFAG